MKSILAIIELFTKNNKYSMGRKKGLRKRRKRTKKRNVKSFSKTNVQAPASMGVMLTNGGALRTMTLSHREYVKPIVVSAPGPNQVTRYRIQPGDLQHFPWLSEIALRFESYKFLELSLEYIPDVGTDTQGSIAICPDYDAADDNSGASKGKLLAFEDSVRGPLWNTLTCRCTTRIFRNGKPISLQGLMYTRVITFMILETFGFH